MPRIVTAALVAALLAVPAQAGPMDFAGYSSWYGGSCDSSDNNQTASGISNDVPGFATRWVPFGTWFVIHDHRRRAIGLSLERGPASWTGRAIDVNWSLARQLGYPVTLSECVIGYPNGPLRAEQIIPGLRYPSCGWAGRRAGLQLRRRVGRLGRPGNCLYGTAARRMRRFQRAHHRPAHARRGVIDLSDWRALYRAG